MRCRSRGHQQRADRALGQREGVPSGAIRLSRSPTRLRTNSRVPGPCSATTSSMVPASTSARWIEKARRSSIEEVPPPTARVAKCPGLTRRAASGARSTSRRYAPAGADSTTSASV
ncbi:hypothetical protein ACFQ0T_05170 [Kitasatospora gansuensis]